MAWPRISSSTVSMRFGQSSPSSSIFCLPTLPQRGSMVASSLSVAHECKQVARPDLVAQILRVVRVAGVLHRVEVIEVAVEFVEAVDGGQELVPVAEVVLAELAGGVAHGLERRGHRHSLRGDAGRRARLTDRGHAGANRQLTGDEVRATRGAARLRVVVGEPHSLGGQLVQIRRTTGHHALVVGTDVKPADVVAHDDDDVRLLGGGGLRVRRGRSERASAERGSSDQRQHVRSSKNFSHSLSYRGACRGHDPHL